ncbi:MULTISPECIES: serine/threonine-protein kinase [unclassified Streptomyces]|uniref:non-specific serine/threonine protein kinase n=1 Tax=Streptomyces sp. NBC_00119 TaxID=2975659 RepID=A0AAU1U7M6_9ACTN|nr:MULTISPECIES: serine/threonine-protein kinase [unclassified Streptomyces]MCX4643706.1 serine/threonine protein kinase [Streptomyces sp. NBC_01446]MCX5324816.1 serine/threonine protein kinase [Streptomyces sp. NBC_00120]
MSEAEQAGTARQDKSARLLAGRYRLGEVLGRGGMGTVWRAKDETLGRTVAVKELRFPSSIDDEEKRRLITRTLREAKAIARIRNNSAVTVYDVVDEDDRPWIVMELVEGKSLAEQIREDGLLEPRRAAEVGLAILDVLRAAHREGILHRDVKPSNVLIAEDGRVVLTDFGIAQVEGDPSITSTGMLVGAPSYISPERARGHKPGPAADLWSLGGLLYASVEGVPPYDKGSAIATLTAVMTEPVDPPKNAGPLEKVIYGLLAKDPEQRLDDAGARALLNDVLHAPEPKDEEPEPVDATKVVPLPPIPEQTPKAPKAPKVRFGKGSSPGVAAGSGASAASVSPADAGDGTGAGKRGEEAAEKLRGALRSVRKAAAAATAATAAGAAGKSGGAASGGTEEASAHPAAGQGGSGVPAQPAGPPRTPATRASLTDVVPRRTLVIVAVLVALAVIGTVIGIAFSGGDDGGSAKGGDKSASAGATGGGGGGSGSGSGSKDKGSGSGGGNDAAQDGGKGSDKGQGSGSDTDKGGDKDSDAGQGASPGSTSGGSGVPGGSGAASTYKHDQGFSIGLPKGWKYSSTSAAGARFTGPDGQKLLVGWTTTPKSNPVQDWRNQEQYMRRSQYDRIRIAAVDFRGWNTADWEFTYVDGGTKYRSIDRGFVVNSGLGYGLMYTAKAADWDGAQRKAAWQTFTKTFKPKS